MIDFRIEQNDILNIDTDILIVNLFEGVKSPSGATGIVDSALSGLISQYVIQQERFDGKFGNIYIIPTFGKIKAKKVMLVGLGKKEKFSLAKLRELSAKIIKNCIAQKNVNQVCSILHGAGIGGFSAFDSCKFTILGAFIGAYAFDKYKSKKQECNLKEFLIVEQDDKKFNLAQNALKEGIAIGKAINFSRDLSNEPADFMTPEKLANIASNLNGIDTKIFDTQMCKQLGMTAFLAVAKGSNKEPKFIHMQYKPENPRKKIALIGKGLTFDSGGMDLKPASSMLNMKDDMSAAATVVAIMSVLKDLNIQIEVHGLVAACENMIGPNSYKPGDILTAKNGKTIEIDNTDAEGRLTLADALVYADKELLVDEIIDIATLTGACVVALGNVASAIFSTNEMFMQKLIDSSKKAQENLWPLPLYEQYNESLKSEIADLKNTGSRYAGASTAACFLKNFVNNPNWAHIDIAGTAFLDKPLNEFQKGATGACLQTLLHFLLN